MDYRNLYVANRTLSDVRPSIGSDLILFINYIDVLKDNFIQCILDIIIIIILTQLTVSNCEKNYICVNYNKA